MTESQTKGLGALVTSLLTLFLLVLGALLIQPRLLERRQLLPDRYVLTADEVAALPQGTLPVVLDRRLGQDQNDFRFRLLKLVLERSCTQFALGFSAAVQPQDEAIAALAEGQKTGRRNPLRLSVGVYGAGWRPVNRFHMANANAMDNYGNTNACVCRPPTQHCTHVLIGTPA